MRKETQEEGGRRERRGRGGEKKEADRETLGHIGEKTERLEKEGEGRKYEGRRGEEEGRAGVIGRHPGVIATNYRGAWGGDAPGNDLSACIAPPLPPSPPTAPPSLTGVMT